MTSSVVHKYGGSSLAQADGFLRVVAALARPCAQQRWVVVSAPGGVTDCLICAFETRSIELVRSLKQRLLQLSSQLGLAVEPMIQDEFIQLSQALNRGDVPEAWISRGEYWSAYLLQHALHADGIRSAVLDAHDLISLQPNGTVDANKTETAIRRAAQLQTHGIVIVPGFVAQKANGQRGTLGRNGSDYTASLIAASCKASRITLWSDTDGVLTADPDFVPRARPLPAISYDALHRLAQLGTGVVHPQAVQPVMERHIPLHLANSFRPQVNGTEVRFQAEQDFPVVCGRGRLTYLQLRFRNPVSVESLEAYPECMAASGFGVHFNALIETASADHVRDRLNWEFPGVQITAQAGVYGIFLVGGHRTLPSRTHIDVQDIEFHASLTFHGGQVWVVSSNRNLQDLISVFHDHTVHADSLSLIVIGDGPTAESLLESLQHGQQPSRLPFALKALVAGSKICWSETGIDPQEWEEQMAEVIDTLTFDELLRRVQVTEGRFKVIVDAREDLQQANYGDWLEKGFDVVTANRAPLAGPLDAYEAIQLAQERHGSYLLCEGAVNGAVWAIDLIRHLMDTGDSVVSIQGVLCGFQSWLWTRLARGDRFSELIMEAVDVGLASQDPRRELSCIDAIQRWIVLARECGFRSTLAGCTYEPVLSESFNNLELKDLQQQLEICDPWIEQRVSHALEAGLRLAQIGSLTPDGLIRLEVTKIPQQSGLAQVSPGDIYLEVVTSRLARPLVFSGPGIGPDAAASGLLSDLTKLADRRGLIDHRPRYAESSLESPLASSS